MIVDRKLLAAYPRNLGRVDSISGEKAMHCLRCGIAGLACIANEYTSAAPAQHQGSIEARRTRANDDYIEYRID